MDCPGNSVSHSFVVCCCEVKMSGGSNRNTRSETRCSYVGSSKELPLSEFPTQIDVIAYANLLKERNIGDLKSKRVIQSVSDDVKKIFKKVGTNLPLISDTSIYKKVKGCLENYMELRRKTLGVKKRQPFLSKMDLIFDLIQCRCTIVLCEDFAGCDGCNVKAHVVRCKCGATKIPSEDLHFVWDQRQRCEGRPSSYQLQNVDLAATRRVAEAQQRELNRGSRTARQEIRFDQAPDWEPFSSSTESEEDVEMEVQEQPQSSGSLTLDIKSIKRKTLVRVAREAERYKMSNRGVSCICTALLMDLGIITESCTDLIIDKNKIHRLREKIRKNELLCPPAPREMIQGLEYDGRKDKTLVKNPSSKGIRLEKEEHVAVLKQPGRHFLTHFTPASGQSEHNADELEAIVYENGLQACMKTIACDSTNPNTGHENGVNVRLERKLGHRLVWHICQLHTNELPLRHLVSDLDGPTTGKDSFSGAVGKLAKKADTLPAKTFRAITSGIPMRALPPDVVNDLSTDQKYLYQITSAINNGSADPAIYTTKIGPMDHSRWLTLASRICRIYISEHGLVDDETGNDKTNLESIVTFIVTCYAPLWFDIKCEPLYKDAPKHVLSSIQRFKLLPSHIKPYVEKYIRKNAYFAHSENLLMAMVADPDQSKRKKAVEIIEGIRGEDIFGDDSPRPFKVPQLNFEAEDYDELIDWGGDIYEPLITAEMGIFNVRKIIDERLFIGKFECHTQAVERTIKEVTKASKAVVGRRRRDGMVRATIKSRKMHPRSETKKDFLNLINDEANVSSSD